MRKKFVSLAILVILLLTGTRSEAADFKGGDAAALSGPEVLRSNDDFLELCEDGTPEEIERAIASGANISARNDDDAPPLHIAAEYNKDPRAVAVLLKNGADANALKENNVTPLIDSRRGTGRRYRRTPDADPCRR